jgi:hypothetical protein
MSAKQNSHIILPFLGAFFLTAGVWATAQRNQPKQSRFVNFENSPVALEELGNSHQVRNASSKTVVKFTLACLITPNGKPSTVVLKFPAKETDIEPGDASGEIRVDSPSSSEICAARKTKLAVIDVMFSDGSQWLAPVERKSPKSVGDGSTTIPTMRQDWRFSVIFQTSPLSTGRSTGAHFCPSVQFRSLFARRVAQTQAPKMNLGGGWRTGSDARLGAAPFAFKGAVFDFSAPLDLTVFLVPSDPCG